MGRGGVDCGGAKEPGGADPDVKAAPGVEGFVDEGQGVRFRGDGVGVVDYFCVGVELGEGGAEAGAFVGGLRAGVDAGYAVDCGEKSGGKQGSLSRGFFFVDRPASSVAIAFPMGWLAEVTTQTKP